MSFKFPYLIMEHVDHGQLLATVHLSIFGVHKRFVHLQIIDSDILEVSIAVPKIFYDKDRIQLAEDEGDGSFNVNTHKATAFQEVCKNIGATAAKHSKEVLGEPQLIKLPFPCEEKFYRGHGRDKLGWEVELYDNNDQVLKDEIGNTDLFTLAVDCVAIEKPPEEDSPGRMRRVTRARVTRPRPDSPTMVT